MRTALVLSLVLFLPTLARAEPAEAAVDIRGRFPEGVVAYVEADGLGDKVAALLASPLGQSIKSHPAVQAFHKSAPGLQLQMGQMFLRGATGRDLLGIFKAVAGRRVGAALYGKKKVLLVAHVEGEIVQRLLKAAETMGGMERKTVVAKDDRGPALWKIGPAFVGLDGNVLFASSVQALAESARTRSGGGLKTDGLQAARAQVGAADLFGYVDLKPFRAMLQQGGKPKDLGQAFFLGAFAHYVPKADWAGFGLSLKPQEGDMWGLSARGVVPLPGDPQQAVVKSFGGTLKPLPFKLPAETIGVLRFKRNLAALWENRDDLIDERGLAGLVEFETNFSNLTYMSFVEEFLPNVGDELILLGTRRTWKAGAPVPAVKLPQGALLWPLKDGKKFALKLQLTFNSLIGILNLQAGQEGANPLLMQSMEYNGTMIHTSRYLPAKAGEMDGRKNLPLRFNFTPSVAIIGDYLVLSSTSELLKSLVDLHGGAGPAPDRINSGLWLEPAALREVLKDNREPLIANSMLKEGDTRAEAEQKIDFALDAGRYLRSLSVTADESRAALGATIKAVFGPTK